MGCIIKCLCPKISETESNKQWELKSNKVSPKEDLQIEGAVCSQDVKLFNSLHDFYQQTP